MSKKGKGFFVTGTGTGVGKTVIAGALVRLLQKHGLKAGAMKPVESGCLRRDGAPFPQDGSFLREISGMDEGLAEMTPYAFEAPLAPMVAAEMENTRIEPGVIMEKFERLSGKYGAMIVEGAGGLLVPLRDDFFVIDLARALALPLVIVAKAGLGTVNHTLLTVRCALSEGLEVAGVILNRTGPEEGLAEKTNPDVLKKFSPVPVLGVFPCLGQVTADSIERAADCIETGTLKSFFFD
ncbi:MAG: dethiobiotin synthase [Nitrospiraceae bacterium]|nr:dethiobiotin synthase [Nitrospiraceae bacterium]